MIWKIRILRFLHFSERRQINIVSGLKSLISGSRLFSGKITEPLKALDWKLENDFCQVQIPPGPFSLIPDALSSAPRGSPFRKER
jgi:hypothetical protein